MTGPIRQVLGLLLLIPSVLTGACVHAEPAADTGNTLSPTASLPDPRQPLAYEPEMRQLFASDCVYCHGGYRVDGGYSMNTYEDVVRDLMGVVNTTQPGKKMYPYWSGNEATRLVKADMARRWVEVYRAQRTP